MSDEDHIIDRFLASDPIAGTHALQELLELGDSGEEALFSRPIAGPKTVQVRRRWLRYVASRQESIAGRLIDRMQVQDKFNDSYSAAYLFAGLGDNRSAINALYAQIKSGFTDGYPASATIWNTAHRFLASGYAGGENLWHLVENSSYAWEKLRTFAFRGSCAAFARTNADDSWAIERLITHEWRRNQELSKISGEPVDRVSNDAIAGTELGFEANYTFTTWRRGEVADEVLHSWSQHAHWRVRDFGAQILASLGFQRTVTPIVEWLRRELVQHVRVALLHALETSETTAGADALIEHFHSSRGEGGRRLARAAWRASDRNKAITVLNALAGEEDNVAGSEAAVSLARLGHRYARLTELLDSDYYYCRLNAALAFAYLGEKSACDRLVPMQREASTPFERVFLAAALAILGNPNGAAELNRELIAGAVSEDCDIFFMHRYLQRAVIDGLAAGGAHYAELHGAWRAEMVPLEPIAKPVVPPPSKPVTISSWQSSEAASLGSTENTKIGEDSAGPLNVEGRVDGETRPAVAIVTQASTLNAIAPSMPARMSASTSSKKLLLFLHGLGGQAASTWGRFPEFLMADREMAERFAVGYYSYPTSLFRRPFSSRAPKVQELAAGLRTQINHEELERVDLVCHSLGGLVARRYLIEEVKADRPLRVERLALFAVPNNGAGLASVGQFVSWRHNQIKQLCRNADLIEFLNEDWFRFVLQSKAGTTLRTKFIVGTQDEVVDRFSVAGYWGNPDVETIVGLGHINLVKPDRADDLVVKVLRKFHLA